jgi:hypothetical protein
MRLPVIALLALLPLAVLAAEEPEAVLAKYHRAAMAGNPDDMLAHSAAWQRAEAKAMSAANREASFNAARSMMPRFFTVERKTLPTEDRVTLVVSGPWESGPSGRVHVYGTALLLWEGGDWKVSEVSWSTDRPELLSTPQAAPSPSPAYTSVPVPAPAPAPAAAQKATDRPAPVSTKGAPVVGSMSSSTPGRTLGTAKPPCVYKAVMTAEDIENCK